MAHSRAKQVIKESLPDFILNPLLKCRSWFRYDALHAGSTQDVFTKIARENLWRSAESQSGAGSELNYTRALRDRLADILADVGATSLLDAPCGDFHWMQHVDIGDRQYYGVDIVPEIIEKLQATYGNDHRTFSHRDIILDELPKADLILCRDCFIHLSNCNVLDAIKNFRKTGARFFLTTTFPDQTRNVDIFTGAFRPMNLELKPFNFPKPRMLLHEGHDSGFEKHAGLWEMKDIPVE